MKLPLTVIFILWMRSGNPQEQDVVVTSTQSSSTQNESSVTSSSSTTTSTTTVEAIGNFDPLSDDPIPRAPIAYPTTRQTGFTDEQLARDQGNQEVGLPTLSLETTLIHVHAIWRHGNRAPEWFPANAPFAERESWPGGLNSLTAKGLQQCFHLGELLRERYSALLAGRYVPNKFYVRSSDTDRTILSAEAMMNGLVSVDDYGVTETKLKVFPVHTIRKETDKLLNFNIECPAREEEQNRVFNVADYGFPALAQKTASFMRFVQNQTGESELDYQAAYKVWDYLYYLEADERQLPSWATADARENLEFINGRINQGLMMTPKLLRLRAGPILKEMSERLQHIAKGSYSAAQKFYGYSAHDHTLAFLLKILGLKFERFPEPSSALILELHRRSDDEHFVKMYFRNFTADTFQEIKLPQCHGDCHLQTFLAFLQSFIPEDWERECGLNCENYQGSQTFAILLFVAIAQAFLLVGVLIFMVACLVRTLRSTKIVNPLEKLDF